MIKYICCLIILFIIFFGYCHINKLKTINNTLNILQTSDPDPELAYELFEQHQPIVFQRELYFWKEINKLINKSLPDIKATISNNTAINYTDIIKVNMEPYNIPLSYEWNIDIRNIILDDKNGIFFVQQKNYLQCFGCITGEFRIIITPPDQLPKLQPLVNCVSTLDVTALLDKDPMEINFIEIVVRKGNLIYIPWNWLYFIYRAKQDEECVIIDYINKSVLSIIP
jgi:hypothetical protein